MTLALTLAGMPLGPDEIIALAKRLRTMNILKDSSFYQVIDDADRLERLSGAASHCRELVGVARRNGMIEPPRPPSPIDSQSTDHRWSGAPPI